MSMFGESRGAAIWRPLARVLACAGLVATLAACGGGQQLVAYVPQRILALGDETSVITSAGRKYTVNALQTTDTTQLDCAANPIWIQYVSNSFGLVFPECNPNAVASPRSRILATPGAKVADFTAQVDRQLAGDGFSSTDMVTVLVGGNDVLEQYRRYPTITQAQAIANIEAAGDALAVQVNRIANAGGKVVLAKVLDLGQTPFGLAEQAAKTDIDRSAFLTLLAARFNARLRVGIVNDGRKIGLVQTDERIQTVVRFPGSFGFVNVTQAACLATVAAPACSSLTLGTAADGTAANGSTWLWADQLNLSPAGHLRIGEVAEVIARNNPF